MQLLVSCWAEYAKQQRCRQLYRKRPYSRFPLHHGILRRRQQLYRGDFGSGCCAGVEDAYSHVTVTSSFTEHLGGAIALGDNCSQWWKRQPYADQFGDANLRQLYLRRDDPEQWRRDDQCTRWIVGDWTRSPRGYICTGLVQ